LRGRSGRTDLKVGHYSRAEKPAPAFLFWAQKAPASEGGPHTIRGHLKCGRYAGI